MNHAPRTQDLDPEDWTEMRVQGHRMLDDMFDGLEGIGERPLLVSTTGRSGLGLSDACPSRRGVDCR